MDTVRARSEKARRVAVATCLTLAGLTPPARSAPAGDAPRPTRRIVHQFDFDERAEGNLEDLPKYWMPFRPEGFPHFAVGKFDFAIGREAPPSFYLSSEGRNVAFHYSGPEARVRSNSTYRIEGFMRPDRLEHARAALSAHFVNKRGEPMIETMARSRYIGGRDDEGEWVRIELYLPAAPLDADSIGLIAWVLQEHEWNQEMPTRRHIPHSDVHGGAWIDDITIHALPRVELTTTTPGNILPPDEPQELRVILADRNDASLSGRLSIWAADGGLVESHRLAVVTDPTLEPVRIPVDHLAPGSYLAELRVLDATTVIATRTLRFARLAPLQRVSVAAGRAFGVVVEPGNRADPTSELALLLHQGIGAAKLPIWSGLADDDPTAADGRARENEQQELLEAGFALTGMFLGPPGPIVRAAGPYPRPLVEVLTADAANWREHLAAAVAPRASTFHWWQVGPENAEWASDRQRLDLALNQLREAMRQFITVPRLAVSAPTYREPEERTLPVEQLSLTVGSEVQSDLMASTIERVGGHHYERLSAFIPPLSAEQYRRIPRLAEWAQRVVTARHGGADTVFVPQTWHVRTTSDGRVTEPTEEYVILRTIADTLGDALPAGTVRVASSVRCLAFHQGDESVLVLWDPDAPPEGTHQAMQLGRADRMIDLWGQSEPLRRGEDGRQTVHLSALPVFVPGVDRWLVEFCNSLMIEPKHVESGGELSRHEIRLANGGSDVISGEIVLFPPPGAELSPRQTPFHLMPQREDRLPVELQFPHNEPAGKKEIRVAISLAGRDYYLEVPLTLDLGPSDVEVWGVALVERGELRLRQVVTNRSNHVLHFRGAAAVPGRQRQYRPITNLRPGETQSVEYRFAQGAAFSGQTVRVGLREMNDGPRIHTLELRVP